MKSALTMLRIHVENLDWEIRKLEGEIGGLIRRREPLYIERDMARLALAAIEPDEPDEEEE